ncbi:MAG TPA: hypothetical protein VGN26_11850 [Armatimonadota bacterium]
MKRGWYSVCLLVLLAVPLWAQTTPDKKDDKKRPEPLPARIQGLVLQIPSADAPLVLEDLNAYDRQVPLKMTPTTSIDGVRPDDKKGRYKPLSVGEVVLAHTYTSGDEMVVSALERLTVYDVPPRGKKFVMPPRDTSFGATISRLPTEQDASLGVRKGKRDVKVLLTENAQVLVGDSDVTPALLPLQQEAKLFGRWQDKTTFVAHRLQVKGPEKPKEPKAKGKPKVEPKAPEAAKVEAIDAAAGTLSVKQGDTALTVTLGAAEILDAAGKKLTLGDLKVGDSIVVDGKRDGTTVAATRVTKQ